MAATVTRLPVAMKRGRKVRTGPMATITPIRGIQSRGDGGDVELTEVEQLAAVAVARLARRKQLWTDFLANHPKVIQFPSTAWHRTPQVVRELQERTRAVFAAEAREEPAIQ